MIPPVGHGDGVAGTGGARGLWASVIGEGKAVGPYKTKARGQWEVASF